MLKSRWLAPVILTLVALAVGSVAQADPIDPQIIIRGGTGGSIQMTTTVITIWPEMEFASTQDPWPDCVPALVGPLNLPGWTCEVRNRTGMDITSFFISFGAAQPPLGCVNDPSNIFATCIADPNGLFFQFSGGVIPDGSLFFIDFGGFQPNTRFTLVVPEPASLGLLMAGMAAVLGLRRRLR